MQEYVTKDFLTGMAGMIFVVTGVTQIVKVYIKRIDPKWIALVASMLCVYGYFALYIKDFTPQGIYLATINMLLVLGGSVGTFEVAVKPVQRKITGQNKSAVRPVGRTARRT